MKHDAKHEKKTHVPAHPQETPQDREPAPEAVLGPFEPLRAAAPPTHPSEAVTPRPELLKQPAPVREAFARHRTTVETDGAGTSFLVCHAGCGRMAIAAPQDTEADRSTLDELARRSRGQKVQHGPGHV